MNEGIRVLDCTLRDGAHVNSGEFGCSSIVRFIRSALLTNIDILEIGFLQGDRVDNKTTLFSDLDRVDRLVEEHNLDFTHTELALMVRPERCDIEKIKRSKHTKTIRFAFYPDEFEIVIDHFKKARDLGYNCYLNPVAISTYSVDKLPFLLEKCIELEPRGVSIVDTFGAFHKGNFSNYAEVFSSIIPPEIAIGLHLHENLSASFGLVSDYLKNYSSGTSVIIDSSVMGMGRIPGNTPTELVLEFLNNQYSSDYRIASLADAFSVISAERERRKWGYSPEYMVSGLLNIHRSYAEYFVEKKGLDFGLAETLMREIHKRGAGHRFDQNLADELISVDN